MGFYFILHLLTSLFRGREVNVILVICFPSCLWLHCLLQPLSPLFISTNASSKCTINQRGGVVKSVRFFRHQYIFTYSSCFCTDSSSTCTHRSSDAFGGSTCVSAPGSVLTASVLLLTSIIAFFLLAASLSSLTELVHLLTAEVPVIHVHCE